MGLFDSMLYGAQGKSGSLLSPTPGLGTMIPTIPTDPTPPLAPAVPVAPKASIWSYLLGGQHGADREIASKLAQQQEAQTAQQRTKDAADAQVFFPGDDANAQQARLLYASGNQKFRDALASHYEGRVIAAGDTYRDGINAPYTAPKLNDNSGSQTTQYVDHVVQTGMAAPSYSDVTGRINARVRTSAAGGSVIDVGDVTNGEAPQTLTQPMTPASSAQPAGGGTAGVPGGDAGLLARIRQVESGGNDAARNGSSTGRYQFQPGTFAAMGGTDINDPAQQDAAAARLLQTNRAGLTQALGRAPTAGELYLAHQQGLAGATQLLTNPNALATSVRPAAAITQNGGSPNMTAGQFAQMWAQRIAGGGQSAPASPTPAGAHLLYQAPTAPKPVTRTLSPAEVTQMGLAPGTVAQADGQGNLKVIQKHDDKAAVPVKIAASASRAVDAATAQAQKARRIADLSKEFVDLNMSHPTGGGYALPLVGNVAQMTSGGMQRMNQIEQSLIPMQREAGQGPIRIGEISGPTGGIFGGQVVRKTNDGNTNLAIARDAEKRAADAEAQADFLSDYAQKKGTEVGWYPAYLRQKNNGALQARSAATRAPAAPAQGGKVLTYDPATGQLR